VMEGRAGHCGGLNRCRPGRKFLSAWVVAMADPTRSRNIAGAVLAVSVGALLGARALPDESVGHGWHLALILVGLPGAAISGIWMLIAWNDAKTYRRLKAGVGVLARWTVDRERWEWFRGQSQAWDKREGVGPNRVRLDQPCAPSGLEIVVTREALLVGEHFISFEPNVVFRAYPGWVDIFFKIVKPKGPAVPISLRIPLPAGPSGDEQGPKLVEAYRAACGGKNPATITKTKFFVLFFGGLVGVTVLAASLTLLLRRG
jgi:hypothetical protein